VYCHRVYRPERREPSCPAAVHRLERPEPSCPAAAGCHLLRNPAEDFRPNSRAAGCRQSIPEEDYHPSNQQAGCHLRTPAADCRSNRRWASYQRPEPYPEEMRREEDHPLLRRWLHSDSCPEADCRPCNPEAGCHSSRRWALCQRPEPCPEGRRPEEGHLPFHPEESRRAHRTKPAEPRLLQRPERDRLQRQRQDRQQQPELQREHRLAPHPAEDRITEAVREHSTPPGRSRRPTVH
jgi:hypothetical protein